MTHADFLLPAFTFIVGLALGSIVTALIIKRERVEEPTDWTGL